MRAVHGCAGEAAADFFAGPGHGENRRDHLQAQGVADSVRIRVHGAPGARLKPLRPCSCQHSAARVPALKPVCVQGATDSRTLPAQVVATTGPQVAVYNLKQASVLSPFTVDTLREAPSFMCLSERHLLLVDTQGLQLFTLDTAKPVSPPFQPKVSGLRPELLTPELVALSPDTVALVDRSSKGLIRFLDLQGKPMSDPLVHWEEVVEVALNQTGPTLERRLVWLDSNHDLCVAGAGGCSLLFPLSLPALMVHDTNSGAGMHGTEFYV